MIKKTIERYKEWRKRRLRRLIVFRLLANPNHNPDRYDSSSLSAIIEEFIKTGVFPG